MQTYSTKTDNEFRNVDIDIRHEAQILTEEFGIKVLYLRQNKFIKCRCFDDLNKTGNAKCKLCHGSGYFNSIQRIPAIESSNSPYSSNNSIAKLQIGVTDQKNEIYYIQQQYNPKERDFIIKVTWDKNGKPIDVVKVLELINIWDTRGDNGRTEFFACLTNNRTDLVSSFNETIKTLPRQAITELVKGEKSIWPALIQN